MSVFALPPNKVMKNMSVATVDFCAPVQHFSKGKQLIDAAIGRYYLK